MATLPAQDSAKKVSLVGEGLNTLLTTLANLLVNSNLSLGKNGGMPVYDTNVHEGNWIAFYCVTDCVFAANVESTMLNLDFGTWPAGTWIYGITTKFELASGTLVAYNA